MITKTSLAKVIHSSTVLTWIFRLLVPAVILSVSTFLVTSCFDHTVSGGGQLTGAIGVGVMGVIIATVSLAYGLTLKIVSIDSQIHVTHLGKVYSVDPAEIEKCTTEAFLAGHPVAMTLKKSYPFGKSVLFVPSRHISTIVWRDPNREIVDAIMSLRERALAESHAQLSNDSLKNQLC